MRSRCVGMFGAGLAVLMSSFAAAQVAVDHTGVFKSRIGEISIMLGNNEAIISYSAVFGAAAHTCDLVATGREKGNGTYEFKDESGVITLKVTVGGVELASTDGAPAYCGAGWPGDRFGMPPDRRVEVCTIKAERAYFYSTDSPPAKRKAYVVRGDEVLILPCQHSEGQGYVLARFSGPQGAAIGLLRRADLTCAATR